MMSCWKIPNENTNDYNAGNILILDDEFDIVTVFMLALEGQGFHVVGFTEPLLALEHFQKNSTEEEFRKYSIVEL